jgi:chromosome segregation ATPase
MHTANPAADSPQGLEMSAASSILPEPAQPQDSSQWSRYACPAIGSGTGVAADIATVVTAAIGAATGNAAAVYVAIGTGGTSSIIHVIEGIAACVLKPRQRLEQNVNRAGQEVSAMTTQIQGLQADVQGLQQLSMDLKKQLDAEKETSKMVQDRVAAKVGEVRDLTGQLEVVNKRFVEAQELLRSWERATEDVSKQLPSLQPAHLASDMEGITRQMQQLTLSEGAFSAQIEKLGSDATLIGNTQAVWSQMLERLQGTIKGLASDNVQKRELLSSAQMENKKLSDTAQSLRDEVDRLGKETGDLRRTQIEMEQTNAQLQGLQTLLARPDIATLIEKALSQQRVSTPK